MRCVVQRVAQASVTGGGRTASIGNGFCVLVGIALDDGVEQSSKMISQILSLRVFPSNDAASNDRWTLPADAAKAEVLLVPQFTLHTRFKSGRPSFHRAKPPKDAGPFFEDFCERFREAYPTAAVEVGMFGEHMEVSLVNSGPCTFVLDS